MWLTYDLLGLILARSSYTRWLSWDLLCLCIRTDTIVKTNTNTTRETNRNRNAKGHPKYNQRHSTCGLILDSLWLRIWFPAKALLWTALHCTMIPLLTRSCLKSSKLRPILNGQFCHAISKNIGLSLLGSKQPREILVFVILKYAPVATTWKTWKILTTGAS